MILETILALLLVSAAIAILAWKDISTWLSTNRINESHYAEIIKQKLSNGNYKVVAGVFKKNGTNIASKEWETKKLDEELRKKFGLFGWKKKVKIMY